MAEPTVQAGAAGVRMASVEARVIRADGRVKELGVVSYWHASRLRRWRWRLARVLRGLAARIDPTSVEH